MQSITQQILNARQRAAGLELEEDDHTVILKRKDQVLDVWAITQSHPTFIELSEAADRQLEREEGLFDFTEAS
jgi:hypothetical protein